MSERRVYGAQPGTVDTPNWVYDAIFYQIFPDRFAKSDRLDKPHGLEPWRSDPTTYGYKGGDLLGVVEKLDYLQDLGINAIYLNPIFQSASNHRYHTHDYFQVDPLLGGDDAFREMLEACHERGVRVVLDGVFNHASRGFFQFNDALENGRSSPWLDWFSFHNFPLNAYDHTIPPGYSAWVGLHALPRFNTDNPQVREYLMRVGEHWLRQGIDGWRLDVPFEIETPGFWEEFRQRCRAINPNAYLVGEIWRDSRRWLQGDQFDATMNYLFTETALAFCGRDRVRKEFQDDRSYDPWPGIDGTTYAAKIDHLLDLYDWNVQLAQLNLLDSHDTARALTLLGDDRRSLELATLLLFTFPGAPSIYYGDEIGLDGGLPDQWARKTFPWQQPERWDRELHGHYKRLIGLRTASAALRSGTYRSLAATAGSYVFARALGTEQFIVALNTSDGADRIEFAGSLIDGGPLLTVGDAPRLEQQESTLSLNLPARSGVVYRSPRDSDASSNA